MGNNVLQVCVSTPLPPPTPSRTRDRSLFPAALKAFSQQLSPIQPPQASPDLLPICTHPPPNLKKKNRNKKLDDLICSNGTECNN